MWRLSDAGPCRTSPQPPGPAYESPQGRNPREAGHRQLHNAMRISPPRWVYERLAARPERCAGLRGNALHQLRECESGAGAARSRLAGALIGSVAVRPGEHGRGQNESGGGDRLQSVWKRLRCCSRGVAPSRDRRWPAPPAASLKGLDNEHPATAAGTEVDWRSSGKRIGLASIFSFGCG